MSHKPTKQRFGLLALLTVVAIVALSFAGYRNGYDTGVRTGAEDTRLSKITTDTYYVKPLVAHPKGTPSDSIDYQPLINLIKTTIATDSWENGDFSISVFEVNHTLIISQTVETHEEIRTFLDDLETQTEEFFANQ